ncbi:immunity 50 family protein [Bacillus cereus group sp. N14]|uniref:immunity 50 family protein n=1 Tax=Bacillus cereus group sp. N14 TaxID=2794587 RepID=UPI0018F47437|nr:immunity 50 family protein [Bacillus cereus group sp. N14]MBJ8081757.1 immunity 50 family protein [Bacillus cereus group sp. N14]
MIDQLKILNPQALISIFGKVPKFEDAELLEVCLKRDGPTLVTQLMTKENVEHKPKRWNNRDVIYVEISFFTIRNLTIESLGTENIIEHFEISTTSEGSLLKIKCKNQMIVETLFDWARIEGVTPGLIGLP